MKIYETTDSQVKHIASIGISVWTHNYGFDGVDSLMADFLWQTFTPAVILEKLNSSEKKLFSVSFEDRVIGFIEVNLDRPCPTASSRKVEIDKFYLLESFCNRGFGGQMMAFIKNWCKAQGIPE